MNRAPTNETKHQRNAHEACSRATREATCARREILARQDHPRRSARILAFTAAVGVVAWAAPLAGCVKKSDMSQAAKDTEVLVAPPIGPGQMGLTSDPSQTGAASGGNASAPANGIGDARDTASSEGAGAEGGSGTHAEAARALGCEGSFKTAFEEAARAHEKALDVELARRKARGAADRELWRQARLAAVRSLAKSSDAQAASDALGAAPGGYADSSAQQGESADGGDASEGADDSRSVGLLQGAEGSRAHATRWTDDAVRCKTLGTLYASTLHLARLAKAGGTQGNGTKAAANPPLCEAVTPARFGALAATLTCRVQVRGGQGAAFAKEAFARAGALAPSCGDGFARACAEIVRTRLAESPDAECAAFATSSETLAQLQAWGCASAR